MVKFVMESDEGLHAQRFKTKAICEHKRHASQILIGLGDRRADERRSLRELLPPWGK